MELKTNTENMEKEDPLKSPLRLRFFARTESKLEVFLLAHVQCTGA